jgi:protein-disulfide isomerase
MRALALPATALTLLLGLAGCGSSDTGASTEAFDAEVTSLARAIPGLDLAAWQACRQGTAAGARVDQDQALGVTAGVGGTPTFFVNGTRVVGNQPFQAFKDAVDSALATAQASGIAAGQYYDQSFAGLPVLDSPVEGDADAWVTIVEFSDFECPFCAQVQDKLAQVRLAYPAGVRHVFKHFPLGFHALAHPAAVAAQCAHAQGKFWELHDAMFRSQGALF